MHSLRTALALGNDSPAPSRGFSASDARLFLTTFACGFIFVSILIG
jgi:hypothetical protein